MALIPATPTPGNKNRKDITWSGVTEADTMASVAIEGGSYSCNVQGGDTFADADFGGGSIEFQYSKIDEANGFHSIDATNLTFTANGTYNLEIARGFIKPVRTGGSSMDVDVTLNTLPNFES